MALATHESMPPAKSPFLLAFLEVSLILLLFFVYAGRPAPDVNEAHYLTKAKHYWQPDWCAGDAFLNSNDAHLVFYWSAGWLTTWFGLPTVAWIGRLITWGLLAVTWHRFIRSLFPNPGYSLLAAAMALCLWDRFHLAGEWVVGGFEAKGFAFVLLFVALRYMVQQRWAAACWALGAASAFHVLVGGWAVAAVTIVLLLRWRSEQPDPKRVAIGILGGGWLALPGLWPAISLMAGVDATVKQQAAEIYVGRLAHHLEFYRFSPDRIGLFGILLATWITLLIIQRTSPRMQRIQYFVFVSVGIGIFGVALDYFSIVLPVVNRLLRFYWFRLADVMVPMGVVLLVIEWLLAPVDTLKSKLVTAWRDFGLVAILLTVTATLTHGFWTSTTRRCPPAFVQGLGQNLMPHELEPHWRDWCDACKWINENTPIGTRCLTPTTSQTFLWYAQRSEVVVWKNIPQDATSTIKWRDTLNEIQAANVYPKPNAISPPAVVDPRDLAEKCDFNYVITTTAPPQISWPEAYRNGSFIVHVKP